MQRKQVGKQTVYSLYKSESFRTPKKKFILESFQLNENEILYTDEKLKEAVIKLFSGNFEVLATQLSENGVNKGLQIKIYLVLGALLSKSKVRPLNPDQKDNLQKQIDEWL